MKNILLIIILLFVYNNSNSQVVVCNPNLGHYTIYFQPNSIILDSTMIKVLEKHAQRMRINPSFRVVITSYDNPSTSYKGQQLAWDHSYTIIEYMDKVLGVDKERYIFQYGLPLNNNQVTIRGAKAGEEGPCITPPPFPSFSKIKYVLDNIRKSKK